MNNDIDQVPNHGHADNSHYPEYSSATAQSRRFDDLKKREQVKNKAKYDRYRHKDYMNGSPSSGNGNTDQKQYKRNDQQNQ